MNSSFEWFSIHSNSIPTCRTAFSAASSRTRYGKQAAEGYDDTAPAWKSLITLVASCSCNSPARSPRHSIRRRTKNRISDQSPVVKEVGMTRGAMFGNGQKWWNCLQTLKFLWTPKKCCIYKNASHPLREVFSLRLHKHPSVCYGLSECRSRDGFVVPHDMVHLLMSMSRLMGTAVPGLNCCETSFVLF